MDELTLLRRVRTEVEEPSEAALAAGRARLEAAWGTDAARKPRARSPRPRPHFGWRRAGWTAGGVAVACGLAAALVLTNVVGLPGGHGGASPAAASVLNDAASIAADASDPVVPPGHYLKLQTDAVYSSTSDDGKGGVASYLRKNADEQYIPADPSQTWIWVRPSATLYQTFGPASEQAARDDVAGDFGVPTEWVVGRGGCYYGECSPDDTPQALAALPRDPAKLLDHVYAASKGAGASQGAGAIAWIADRLRTGIVPADTRAALFRAAALIPGVEVTDQAATLDGRTGTAVGFASRDAGYRQDIIVDPGTGAFIGEREVLLRADSGMPAGTSIEWTSVTTTVVDSAPRGTSDGGFDAHGCTKDRLGGYTCPSE
jgi:RNA polymerase sigma-70 factor (ECF subfamily)